MNDLIEALQIFATYDKSDYLTGCEHDVLYVYINPNIVSQEHICKLELLGFNASVNDMNFYSYKYGSA